MAKLTDKQEKFAQAYMELGNQTEAYKIAYNPRKATPTSLNRMAKAVYDNVNVASRIQQLRDEVAKRHQLTIDDLIRELEEARAVGTDRGQSGGMVQATMAKAKLLGLDKERGDEEEETPQKVQIEIVDARSR